MIEVENIMQILSTSRQNTALAKELIKGLTGEMDWKRAEKAFWGKFATVEQILSRLEFLQSNESDGLTFCLHFLKLLRQLPELEIEVSTQQFNDENQTRKAVEFLYSPEADSVRFLYHIKAEKKNIISRFGNNIWFQVPKIQGIQIRVKRIGGDSKD